MKVSIVMPVYNGEKYIEYAIKSIINQTYSNIQFILVDGGSNDRTMQIVKKYTKYFHLIISEKDNGMYDAINKGFSKSNGELMLWLNSDDYLFPNAIETAVTIMKEHKEIKWLKGRNVFIDKNNKIRKIGCLISYYRSFIKNGYYRDQGLCIIMQETTFWRRELYNQAGAYVDTNYKLASDFDLWIRFAKSENLYSINTCLGAFREHNNQLSKNIVDYEKECNQIKKLRITKVFLKLIKYPFYIFAMLDWKNKVNIDKESRSYFVKNPGVFQ
jgi:glycosyltransferase involved in cell wall biosynthesis